MLLELNQKSLVLIVFLVLLKLCCPKTEYLSMISQSLKNNKALTAYSTTSYITIKKDVTVETYFQYMDSLVKQYDSLTTYKLSEHILVRANSWIIDTLQNTDYYRRKAKDSFVYNQKKMTILTKGRKLIIPDSVSAKKIINSLNKTVIDINIPEFKIRIYEDSVMHYEFPVRVGRNEKKYFEMSGRIQDLKTETGEGRIVNHVRNPKYVNPVNNQQYYVTRRDDDKVTRLPQIPFIETEINGIRNGQLIHPTTNPVTLGKAYSNGCIGTKEADAWVIYYHAPINTKINIRYNLKAKNGNGQLINLKDIYGYYQ